jgi:hypothetical protein
MSFKVWFESWKREFAEHKFSILFSVLFFVLANVINQFASNYVDKVTTAAVPDLILDHVPPINLEFIYIYGVIFLVFVLAVYVFFFRITEFHKVIGQFSLLILIRSFFMIFTHLGTPAGSIVLENPPLIYDFFNFHNDFFFSGHTAVPFMAFLLFRKEKIGRLFLFMTFILAATVLLMHRHYSIDVFSAFFITYATYEFGRWFFRKTDL